MSKSEKNIDKLSLPEKLKLLTSTPDAVIDLLAKQTGKPASTVEYTPEEIQVAVHELSHTLTPEQYEAHLNEQEKNLIDGAEEISTTIDSIKNPESKKTLEVAELVVDDDKTHETEKRDAEIRGTDDDGR